MRGAVLRRGVPADTVGAVKLHGYDDRRWRCAEPMVELTPLQWLADPENTRLREGRGIDGKRPRGMELFFTLALKVMRNG